MNLTECENGQYGQDCKNVCGHCADQLQCHHVNGVCLKGCNPGYTGNNCTQGTYKHNRFFKLNGHFWAVKSGLKLFVCVEQTKNYVMFSVWKFPQFKMIYM